MSFELLPTVTPFVVAFVGIALVGVLLALGTVVSLVAPHRRVRLTRHESVRSYYGRQLSLGH